MAENTNPPQPLPDQPEDPNAAQQPAPVPPPPAAKKRRRRWPMIVGGVIVFLLLVAVLAPTLLSTGPARSMVLGVVNGNLNGKVEAADWSLGWNSGITVNGLKVRDERGDVIAQASRVRTELSLWKALRSGFTEFALGRTDVDNLDLTRLHVDEEGTPNLAKLAKKPKQPKTSKGGQINVSGDIHVNNMTGNVTAHGLAQTLHINPSNIAVKLTGLNDPIENDVKLAFSVEDPSRAGAAATPGTIALVGTADLLDKDAVNLDTAKVKEQLTLANVDVAAVNPFLAMAQMKLSLAGMANGTVDVNVQGVDNAAATGEIKVAAFQATGDVLNGERFVSNIAMPIKVRRVMEGKNGSVVKVDQLRVVTDYGYVDVAVDASQESLQRLADRKTPGREGRVTVVANFDRMAKLASAMPKTFGMTPDVKVESAHLFAQADAWLFADRVVTKTSFNLADVAGTNKQGKISLQPITSTVDVTYAPTPGTPAGIAQLRDIGVVLESAFAKLSGATGKGGTLAQFTGRGSGDLAKLQEQLAQFSDLGGVKLQGTWTLNATTDGDPAKADAAIKTNAKFTVNDLTIRGLGKYPPIVQPWLDLTASGDLHLKDNEPRSITGGVVALKSNNPDRPTVDVLAKGDLDLKTFTSERFEVSVEAALAKAREEFAAVAPALNYFDAGQVNASAAGSYDGKKLTLSAERPLAVNVSGLAVRQSANANAPVVLRDQSLDASFAGVVNISDDELSADVKALALAAPKLVDVRKTQGDLRVKLLKKTTQLSGTGGVTVFADFKRLGDISKSFAPAGAGGAAMAAKPESGVGELTKGLLNGTLTFARGDKPVTTIAGNFTADVGVTTNKEPINDKIVIALNGNAPDDLTQPLSASVDVKSEIVNASVSDAVVVLARQLTDKTTAFNGPFEILRSAKVRVDVDRLEAMQPIVNSFSSPAAAVAAATPAAAPAKKVTGNERVSGPDVETALGDDAEGAAPLPPLKVLSGKLALNAAVSREGQQTVLKDTTLDLTNLKFQRGEGYYESPDKKINLKLGAVVDAAAGDPNADPKKPAGPLLASIKRIEIRDLTGDLDAGRLEMVKPIVVTDLAASPSATGAVEMSGQLGNLFRLLEALEAAKPGTKYPYTGDYVLSQEVTSKGDTISLVGSLKAMKFKAYDPKNRKEPVFSEDLLTVTNDVAADTKTDTATIRDLSVNMQSTGALAIAISKGQLSDWTNERKITEKLQAKLRVDWPKLWTLVRPMLDPETLKSVKDLELAGVMEKNFDLTGSFPASGVDKRGNRIALTTAQSLRFINAHGGLAFDRVYVNGIEVTKLDLPVAFEKGIVYVQDASKPRGKRYPPAFACNGGTIDLGGVQIDLRHTDPDDPSRFDPHLTIPDANKPLMRDVTLNPVLAQTTLGSYVNPGFANSKEASGLVSVTSVECRDVPFSWFKKADETTVAGRRAEAKQRRLSSADGRAEFVFSIEKVRIDNPVLEQIVGGPVNGDIKKGTIVVARGEVKSDIPITINEKSILGFSGSVDLVTGSIRGLNASVPKNLFNPALMSKLPKDVTRFIPAEIIVPFKGSLDKLQFDPFQALVASATGGSGKPEDLLKNLPGLLNGGKDDKRTKGDEPVGRDSKTPRSSTDDRRDVRDGGGGARPSDDPVGGLLDVAGGLLNGNKDKKKDDRRDMRDGGGGGGGGGGDPGDQRISGEPRTAGERRAPVTGDQPISADPKERGPTTAPTTAPTTQRNVSGRTKQLRERERERNKSQSE